VVGCSCGFMLPAASTAVCDPGFSGLGCPGSELTLVCFAGHSPLARTNPGADDRPRHNGSNSGLGPGTGMAGRCHLLTTQGDPEGRVWQEGAEAPVLHLFPQEREGSLELAPWSNAARN
jgi:hypothetical protein